jgi:hypothetical protein
MHVPWFGRKQQRGEDFLHDRAHGWKRQSGSAAAHALALDVRVGDRREHDVMLPSGVGPPFEVIESQLGLEFLILLFDRPPLMRQFDETTQRCARREVDQVVLEVAVGFAFAEEPDVPGASPAPVSRARRRIARAARAARHCASGSSATPTAAAGQRSRRRSSGDRSRRRDGWCEAVPDPLAGSERPVVVGGRTWSASTKFPTRRAGEGDAMPLAAASHRQIPHRR